MAYPESTLMSPKFSTDDFMEDVGVFPKSLENPENSLDFMKKIIIVLEE